MVPLLGELLRQNDLIDTADLARALDASQNEGQRLGDCLVAQGALTEEAVYRALAAQFNLPFMESDNEIVNPELAAEFPQELIKAHRVLPLEMTGQTLRIVIADPLDLDCILAISAVMGRCAQVTLTTPSRLNASIEKLFEGGSLLKQSAGKISREHEKNLRMDETTLSLEEIKKRTESEPVVKMAGLIFSEALRLNASDIHIEPDEQSAVIRFRIDGMLIPHMDLNAEMYLPLTSRIKIMAELDIAEKRVPQDGRIRYSYQGRSFDFRVSTLPTHYGEKTVIRLLRQDASLADLSKLGLEAEELAQVGELIEKPQGMIFVTGPTGSGKSSTLFACLNRIRIKKINITTIEDPIEYKIKGINQVQINEKAGISFASTLRSILRQDPDVILIGEIRDRETAEIAIQASQTGHLVFSTLHTNDAISAVTRLRDLGIPGFLIASSLLCILAQRLVRVLCPNCKQKTAVPSEMRERWKAIFADRPLIEAYQAGSCEACNGAGYKGRTGIYELVKMSNALGPLVSGNSPEHVIRRLLQEQGMKSLIRNGIEKVEQGITSPEELLRVVTVSETRS